MADVAYPISQKRRLIELVERLCAELERPVCSGDLQRHLRLVPDDRPFLLKCFGQQLLSAAQPLKGKIGRRLYRVGTYGAKNYYAPAPGEPWTSRFAAMVAAKEWANFEHLGIAAAFHEVRSRVSAPKLEAALAAYEGEREFLHSGGSPRSRAIHEPTNESLARIRTAQALINRREASGVLTRLVASRRESLYAFSPWRHLSELRWPQCAGAPERYRQGYLVPQMESYVVWRWPQRGEDVALARARFYGWRYGVEL